MTIVSRRARHPDIRESRAQYRELLARIVALEQGSSGSVFAVGDMKFQMRPDPDPDWWVAEGQEVSRTDPENGGLLFDVIGANPTIAASGNGTTTYNVPDMRKAAAVGADTGGGLNVGDEVGVWEHDHDLPNTQNATLPALPVSGSLAHNITLTTQEMDTPSIGGGPVVVTNVEIAEHELGGLAEVADGQGSHFHPGVGQTGDPKTQKSTAGVWVIKYR